MSNLHEKYAHGRKVDEADFKEMKKLLKMFLLVLYEKDGEIWAKDPYD